RHERLRGGPQRPRGARRARRGAGGPDRLRRRGGATPLPGGRLRPPPSQAGRSVGPARAAGLAGGASLRGRPAPPPTCPLRGPQGAMPTDAPAAAGLILCDGLVFASRVAGAARALGVAVAQARTPEALLDLARRHAPRCVLVDLDLPGLDA